ncbi:unnamed protein product [Lactuca saligna]|uniref:RNA 3'-terminal phosphate cyclase domain-containing protein n=1 Tax=Lactuca saligna TaxID=75948 RepID=A0AA36E999_LACSI|nr:unnamed protein product [Lactuca saligna]
MRKVSYMKLKGSQNLRQRLLLSPLASTPILIDDIRADATWLGLLPHEVLFLHLLETISDDCHVEINETGVKKEENPKSVKVLHILLSSLLEKKKPDKRGCLGCLVCHKTVGENVGGCCPWLAGNHQQTPLVGVFLLHLKDRRKRSECERKWKNEKLYLSVNSSAFMCE